MRKLTSYPQELLKAVNEKKKSKSHYYLNQLLKNQSPFVRI